MAPRRSPRVLAVPAATPLIRRAAFRRAVEVIPGRVRITTTASQRRRTTTTASQRRRTTTTASRRRAIQSAANQPPAEDPPVTNRRGINSRGTNRRRTNRLPVQDTAPIVTLLQNPDRQRGTASQAEFGTKLGLRRLRIELARMTSNPTDGCTVELVDDCIYDWKAVILGPLGTPYEGGHFKLRLHFPQLYPARPPFLMFLTEVYHCNIRNGAICVDILYSAWSPALTVEKILLSIRSLLSDPNPENPMNGAAAELYKTDREEYNYMARQWTRRFAQPE